MNLLVFDSLLFFDSDYITFFYENQENVILTVLLTDNNNLQRRNSVQLNLTQLKKNLERQ